MKKQIQHFEMHVQFNAIALRTRAKTKSEARKKFNAMLKKKDIIKLLDKKNCSIENDWRY